MHKPLIASLALILGAAGLALPAQAGGPGSGNSNNGSNSGGGGNAQRAEIRLEARMRDGSTESKVAFRSRTQNGRADNKLEAEVRRGVPNTSYIVTVNGVQVGTIVTNSFGSGQIEFQRNVARLQAGTRVSVGTMTGTLQRTN